MTGFSLMIKSLFDALSNFFSYSETKKEHQAETEVLKDKDNLEEAVNIAEDILILAVKYKSSMNKKDQRQLLRLIKRFKKVN